MFRRNCWTSRKNGGNQWCSGLELFLLPFSPPWTGGSGRMGQAMKTGDFFLQTKTHLIWRNGKSCLWKWLEVTELRKVKDLRARGCIHSQGKHSQQRLHKCAAETRDSPGYSHSPGQRRGPKGLVWTTSWADLKTARTLNMLLYPNTRAIHVAQW